MFTPATEVELGKAKLFQFHKVTPLGFTTLTRPMGIPGPWATMVQLVEPPGTVKLKVCCWSKRKGFPVGVTSVSAVVGCGVMTGGVQPCGLTGRHLFAVPATPHVEPTGQPRGVQSPSTVRTS